MRTHILHKILVHTAFLFVSVSSLTTAVMTQTAIHPGDLDPTFGNGGIVITRGFNGNNPNYLSTVGAMAIQPDGKIVVVGEGHDGTFNFCAWDFAVVRYNTDGSLDTSFGGTGRVVTQLSSECSHASAVAIQPDGKIVVAGGGWVGPAVIRYNPNGTLDTSFNGTGIVITPGDAANSVAIQADGKIVVAGVRTIVRYNPNGSLDTTFNSNGKVIIPVGVGASSVAIQADGKIISAGGTGLSGGSFTLVRYNADGSLDTSFNGTGTVITSVGNSGSGASDLAIQPDGKIVAAGYSLVAASDWRTADYAVVRYNPDGSLDTSFGGTGKILIPVGDSADYAYSVAIQPNGKIVVAGDRSIRGSDFVVIDSDLAVVRLNPNGSLDTSFNDTGIVVDSVGNAWDHASSVAIQADGRIVVAGDTGPDEFKDFVVVRYQGDAPNPSCSSANPIDCPDFFISQQYRDFLGREPESCPPNQCGLDFYLPILQSAGNNPEWVRFTRGVVSANFFRSPEFGRKGAYVVNLFNIVMGQRPKTVAELSDPTKVDRPHYAEFTADLASVSTPNDDPLLTEQKKDQLAVDWLARPEVQAILPNSLTNQQFVQKLETNAGVTLANENVLIDNLNSGALTRAKVLRAVAESPEVVSKFDIPNFVTMEYFGYLRRDPEDCHDPANWGGSDPNQCGFIFHNQRFLLSTDEPFIQNIIVRGFIESPEYRHRFGL